jgi:general L-amino acid transport system substrate-binding protein
MGLTSANVKAEKANTSDPGKRRLLGVEGNLGENLGLSNDWAFYIISQVGNYGESFARHLGPDTALNIERGLNALWKDGGLQYSMPAR